MIIATVAFLFFVLGFFAAALIQESNKDAEGQREPLLCSGLQDGALKGTAQNQGGQDQMEGGREEGAGGRKETNKN